jgi:hypothetical protein
MLVGEDSPLVTESTFRRESPNMEGAANAAV